MLGWEGAVDALRTQVVGSFQNLGGDKNGATQCGKLAARYSCCDHKGNSEMFSSRLLCEEYGDVDVNAVDLSNATDGTNPKNQIHA